VKRVNVQIASHCIVEKCLKNTLLTCYAMFNTP
jgi:hypothetical protein